MVFPHVLLVLLHAPLPVVWVHGGRYQKDWLVKGKWMNWENGGKCYWAYANVIHFAFPLLLWPRSYFKYTDVYFTAQSRYALRCDEMSWRIWCDWCLCAAFSSLLFSHLWQSVLVTKATLHIIRILSSLWVVKIRNPIRLWKRRISDKFWDRRGRKEGGRKTRW
jgi:hypothetical protein